MSLLSTINVLFIGGTLFFTYVVRYLTRPRKLPLPPGPRPLPLIGNLRDLPVTKPWEIFDLWSKEYGDVMYLSAFKDNLIVLNSYEAISELLEHRSAIYSDRQDSYMLNKLMGFGGTTINLPYGAIWRKHRKIYNKELNAYAVKKLEAHQSEACIELLVNLLETPESFGKHTEMFTAQVVIGISYDRRLSSGDDELLKMNQENVLAFVLGSQPGYFLVDTVPLLRFLPDWLPGARFKKIGRETYQRVFRSKEIPYNEVKDRMASGMARSCLVTNVLNDMAEKKLSEDPEDITVLKEVASALFAAGSPTTNATLCAFIVAMIMYPDIQVKAQHEIDSVLNGSRFPELADRPSMPYITALLKETLRWFPVTPIAFPHITSADDVYKGYFIPKGSIVMPNAWSVLHDPSLYDKPLEFIPERFLPDKDGNVAKDPSIMGAFGYGRRICPGRFLAENTLWLAFASILAIYKLDYAVDENGKRIDVLEAFHDPTGVFKDFRCSIKPRSLQHERLIRLNRLNSTGRDL